MVYNKKAPWDNQGAALRVCVKSGYTFLTLPEPLTLFCTVASPV